MKNGHFIISLDLELHWGVFDQMPVSAYRENLIRVPEVIDRLLELCEKYEVALTFATVGFLFADSKEKLLDGCPKLLPTYENTTFNPYLLLDSIGEGPADDPYHFGPHLIERIKAHKLHELGTHTFSHYYCLERGQTAAQFEADLNAAIEIGRTKGIAIRSIVFPRNQVVEDYLDICFKNEISSYRGSEKSRIYRPVQAHRHNYGYRLIRLLDTYVNISGFNTFHVKNPSIGKPFNFPSSRFLRPYNRLLGFLEPLKIRRVKKAMQHAALKNEVYHLWWHPHNFGTNMDENFSNLEAIFIEYNRLKQELNFESITMTGLSNKLSK